MGLCRTSRIVGEIRLGPRALLGGARPDDEFYTLIICRTYMAASGSKAFLRVHGTMISSITYECFWVKGIAVGMPKSMHPASYGNNNGKSRCSAFSLSLSLSLHVHFLAFINT